MKIRKLQKLKKSEIIQDMDNPDKMEIKRDEKGRIVEGSAPLNPAGRPKGKTLKEWMRDKLLTMSDDERESFIKNVPIEVQWKMAEGNPEQVSDSTIRFEKLGELLNATKEILSNGKN